MLRIKQSEWQRFCDNAEKLQLIKKGKFYVNYSDRNVCLLEISEKYIYTNTSSNGKAIDILFDLIQQGYVEKVEEK